MERISTGDPAKRYEGLRDGNRVHSHHGILGKTDLSLT